MPVRRSLAGVAAIVTAASAFSAGPAVARTPMGVRCSTAALVAAVKAANARGHGEISLAKRCVYDFTAPYSADDATPPIRGAVTIDGNGATLRRGTTASLFRLLDVAAGGKATISHVTIENGSVTGDGGGVRVQDHGKLQAASVLVKGNTADGDGGGIVNAGTLKLVRSRVIGNRATDSGGGIAGEGDTSVVSTSIAGNTSSYFYGGGVFNDDVLSIVGSTITGNRVTAGDGGGLWNNWRMTVDRSTIAANNASDHGGGVTNADRGKATFRRSVIARNAAGLLAGGIYNVDSGTRLFLNFTSVTRNTAGGAPGGVFNDVGDTLVNHHSRIAGNRPTNCVGSPTPVAGCTA
ncbi:polymorphic outer membrane protein repeat-containing protein [Actinacidiphila rubida]|uniref:Polymorphic outer membrane protein repeat-containing protein n=1 Tax=Actinacidiphila rubida TaxID=310780 RepID=A0A1H8NK56_9ACTN|nr:hypothetical protein [Actinacidiphila rubida]SEO29990.1 polymorphic outer membrane protein repeat-containing protein [Actinacidiphila rubida]